MFTASRSSSFHNTVITLIDINKIVVSECVNFLPDPVSVVPSTYFIGQNGYPLEIILGSVDNTSLVEKLKRVAEVSQSIENLCQL